MLPENFLLGVIAINFVRITLPMANERKRVFKFTKISTLQAISNSDKIEVGKPPILTESTTAISCAALLMQYGPFTCMEYYDLQRRCNSYNEADTLNSLNSKISSGWIFYNANSTTNPKKECKLDDRGMEYKGKVNTTVTGIQCKIWSAPGPHTSYASILDDLRNREGPDIVNTNYCRNVDGEPGGPWCYTMDPNIRWQYCDIPYCQCYT